MEHGGMDHGHMNHGDMDMGDGDEMMCSMNVLPFPTSCLPPQATITEHTYR